jgi:hypothetical protein
MIDQPKAFTCQPSSDYDGDMTEPVRPLGLEDDDAAELAALTVAVAESDADPRIIPHDEMCAWLLELANGNFDAPPPVARDP